MRICFILPHPANGPTGGYKVVLEYANRLVADGVRVDIVYSGSIFWAQKPMRQKLTNIVRYMQHLLNGFSCRRWFNLDHRVEEHLTLSMNYRHMPKADRYVATSPYTAWYLNEYPVESNKKFYLIQDYEDWGPGLHKILLDTYHMPLQKIVISQWLKQLLESHKENAILIPNGFDFKYFTLKKSIENRKSNVVAMLYHEMERKDCATAFKALEIVKRKYPELRVNIFGTPERPAKLPEWYDYVQRPDKDTHNRIYNEAAVFVASSKTEGWGLTVGEAMICGAAVACTDIDGYREMVTDNKTGLLSPVGDAEALAANIIKLLDDRHFRERIATAALENIHKFTWEESYKKLRQVLMLPEPVETQR